MRIYVATSKGILDNLGWFGEIEARNEKQANFLAAKQLRNELHLPVSIDFLRPLVSVRIKEKRDTTKELKYINNLHSILEKDAQWLTGFWEGDGSIYLHQLPFGVFYVSFYQRNPQVLEFIRELLILPQSLLTGPHRGYALIIGKKSHTLPLLELLASHLVSDSRIIQVRTLTAKLGLSITIIPQEPTWPWLAGFWDAEGSSTVATGTTLVLTVSQKERRVLEKIRDFVGSGTLRSYNDYWQLFWSGPSARKLAPNLLKYSRNHEKASKLRASLDYLSYTTKAWRNVLQKQTRKE